MLRHFSKEDLNKSLGYNLIDSKSFHKTDFGPDFIKNNSAAGETVLTALIEELETCSSFDFSVAFITQGGIACLQNTLKKLKEQKTLRGRILTSDYLHFTDPYALKKLLDNFPSIELKIYTKDSFHTKGYLFNQSNYHSLLIGSANLTESALTENQEWNLRVISSEQGELLNKVRYEFEKVWQEAIQVTPEWIDKYIPLHYSALKNRRRVPLEIVEEDTDSEEELAFENKTPKANSMQIKTLENLNRFRNEGKGRALCVAATGTGKTYLAAMDVKQAKPKKVLYLVNRETILKKTVQSFKTILGSDIEVGILTGNSKDYIQKYLFASVWTMVKEETLKLFSPTEFDYIIVDEVHHDGAKTYKTLIDYFKPKFLLGLTATPERTDKFNIFEHFDYNQACNIRLHQALEEKLLCPFHYYGIHDLKIDGIEKDDHSLVARLTTAERVKHIIKNIQFYRNTSEPNRGLIFCSRKEEADRLSEVLNKNGLHTVSIHSDNSDEELREQKICELEDPDNPLEYIISVDILNEGIDIPSVNQIIFLRPTKSSIVYIQQLGRGLRKNEHKSYLTVLDFIGNYEQNYMIPIALFGDNSMNKDDLRKKIFKRSLYIPGSSTIDFDKIAEQRIFKAITNTNFQQHQILVEKYRYLRNQLNRIPTMMEFAESDSIDPINFMFHSVCSKDGTRFSYNQTYEEFVCKVEKKQIELNKDELTILSFVCKELSNGIRLHESLLLETVIEQKQLTKTDFCEKLQQAGITIKEEDLTGCINILNGDFYKQAEKKGKEKKRIYSQFDLVTVEEDVYKLSNEFGKILDNNDNFKIKLIDAIKYCTFNWYKKYSTNIRTNNFCLYAKYTRKDVCRLLNWKKNEESTMYGYKKDKDTNSCPIFVTYQKTKEEDSSTNYKDFFIDNYQFAWQSKSGITMKNDTIQAIINSERNGLKLPLFIMKSDNEGGNFYYMGECTVCEAKDAIQITDKGKKNIVNIIFNMKTPVKDEILNYLNQDLTKEDENGE
ncbi:MAG: DEAD/DEAH box helicase [Treponema sp.]|nr:DEAD/DEAH box helicase [Treponema sp.]